MASFIRWLARILSSLIVLMFLLFIVAHLFVDEKNSSSSGLTTTEAYMFVAVGIMLLGLILAWKWEAAGGLLAIVGYTSFAILEGDFFIAWPFTICLISAVLFLISWFLNLGKFRATGANTSVP